MTIKTLLINIFCSFIPSRYYRHYIRALVNYGVIEYFTKAQSKRFVAELIFKEHKTRFENFLCICSIMKNEGEYLKEWLDYHIKIGVEKFYLCDNESTDNTCKILQPYIEKGIVDYTYWKGKGQQLSTYRNAIKRTKTKWLAFIDLDEFIVYKGESIIDFLKRQPDNVSQVSLGWVIYGSNGHIKKPKGGIIENYQYRAKRNCSCKSISKPMAAYSCNSAHCTHVIGRTINENERTIIPSRDVVLPFEKFRINHYQVKSLEEYRIRQKRGDVGTSSDRYSDEFFKKYDRNEVYDPL